MVSFGCICGIQYLVGDSVRGRHGTTQNHERRTNPVEARALLMKAFSFAPLAIGSRRSGVPFFGSIPTV